MKINIQFFQNDFIKAIGAGIYEISVIHNNISKTLYIGESVFVLVRCATHLFELKRNPNYLGFTSDSINNSNITLVFSLIESNNDKYARKRREKEIIKQKQPISQNGISDRQKNIKDKNEAMKQFLESSSKQ